MDKETKEAIKVQYRQHETDSGSSDVQIALLSRRIEELTEHLKGHLKDHSSRHGLIKMVSKRRTLLDYLKSTDEPRYADLVKKLKLRH